MIVVIVVFMVVMRYVVLVVLVGRFIMVAGVRTVVFFCTGKVWHVSF